MIDAKILADSLGPSGVRLTTWVLTYPRFIHSEFMTHRVFSRNASSSRAIPIEKQIQMVLDNPAIPIAFTKNKKGMQGGEPLTGEAHDLAVQNWLDARNEAVKFARNLAALEVHKQYANRLLEPFAHITVVVTGTDFSNFFALRYHSAAQPEIHALAKQMAELYSIYTPDKRNAGEWHLPFVTSQDWQEQFNRYVSKFQEPHSVPDNERYAELLKISVARCARVSYHNHAGKRSSLEEDLALYERLVGSFPLHASPAEHQAMAVGDPSVKSGNLRGWVQYRKTLSGENIERFEVPVGEAE